MLKRTESIESIGLEKHLNQNYGEKGGYDEFKKRMDLNEPKTVIARAFDVSSTTIYDWIKLYEKEVASEHSK